MCMTGGTVGKTCILKAIQGKMYLNQRVACIRSISNRIIPDFLYFVMVSPAIREIIASSKTSTNDNISMETISSFLCPVPPLEEQKRIVDQINEISPNLKDYELKENQRIQLNIAFPDQLKKSILQEAVQGKLVPQDPNDEPASVLLERIRAEKERLIAEGKIKRDKHESLIFKRDNSHYEKIGLVERCIDDEIPFEIPDSWEWVRLSLICNVINGFTPLRANPIFWDNGTIPWFTVEDIHSQGRQISYTKQHITESALNKDSSRILPPETVLLCCTASVGEYAISKIPLTTNQQFNGLVIYDYWKEAFSSEFLFILVQTFKKRLIDIAGKTTINYVSVKKLNELLVPVPPFTEQLRIVESINKVLPSVNTLIKD